MSDVQRSRPVRIKQNSPVRVLEYFKLPEQEDFVKTPSGW